MKKSKVVLVPQNMEEALQNAEMTFAEMQDYVKHPDKEQEGTIECISMGRVPGSMYLNENGIALQLPMNERATRICRSLEVGLMEDDFIKGNAIIVGPTNDDGDLTDVHPRTLDVMNRVLNERPVKVGDRVGAILAAGAGVVKFLGYGVYDGEHEPPFRPFGMTAEQWHQAALDATGRPPPPFVNPRITLDTGEVVWGMQCWWGPEERIREDIAKYDKVEMITMAEALAAVEKSDEARNEGSEESGDVVSE